MSICTRRARRQRSSRSFSSICLSLCLSSRRRRRRRLRLLYVLAYRSLPPSAARGGMIHRRLLPKGRRGARRYLLLLLLGTLWRGVILMLHILTCRCHLLRFLLHVIRRRIVRARLVTRREGRRRSLRRRCLRYISIHSSWSTRRRLPRLRVRRTTRGLTYHRCVRLSTVSWVSCEVSTHAWR